jgi:hypothetical protein
MIYNQLNTTYTQIVGMNASDPESKGKVNKKLLELAAYINDNGKAIQEDLVKNRDHIPLLQRIGRLGAPCATHLVLKALLRSNDPKSVAEWVLNNKEGIVSENRKELFEDLSSARKMLLDSDLLEPDVGYALSHLVVHGLGLTSKDSTETKKNLASIFTQVPLEALAHWINDKKLVLKEADLSYPELLVIAPYLHHVDLTRMYWDDNSVENFIKSCSNAYHMTIFHEQITDLNYLPTKLRSVICNQCAITSVDLSKNIYLESANFHHSQELESISFSKNELLKEVDICHSRKLMHIDLMSNRQLKSLNCDGCLKIQYLDLSNNEQLQNLNCNSTNLLIINLSKNGQLKNLDCSTNEELITLDLSNNLQLESLNIGHISISTIDLSHNQRLKTVDCNNCENLSSLGDSLSNTLEKLNCEGCFKLQQLPQMPCQAVVHSGGSLCGKIHSLKVYPPDLEAYPQEALSHLGLFLLAEKPMPNIVYIDPVTKQPSAGIDAGGLRRQFVATLCANLLKEGGIFNYLKGGPAKNNIINTEQLKVFARLLGLAATSSLLTGVHLPLNFFYSLFALSNSEIASITIGKPLPENLAKKLYMARQGLPVERFTAADAAGLAQETSLLEATALIAKELLLMLGTRFRDFSRNVESFMVKVQGMAVTKEGLKRAIICDNPNYKNWMNSFIDSLNAKQLQDLVMLFTGSYSLGDIPIVLDVYPSNKHLKSCTVIHTCTQTMDLPGDFTQDEFLKEFAMQLKLVKSFNAS